MSTPNSLREREVKLRFREIVGALLITVSLILVPAAWAFSRALWLLAFFALVSGAWLFYTERNIRKEEELDRLSGHRSGQGSGRPNDIHDYTGWSRAGRSETMDTSVNLGESDGD
jgi:hypothetical protein